MKKSNISRQSTKFWLIFISAFSRNWINAYLSACLIFPIGGYSWMNFENFLTIFSFDHHCRRPDENDDPCDRKSILILFHTQTHTYRDKISIKKTKKIIEFLFKCHRCTVLFCFWPRKYFQKQNKTTNNSYHPMMMMMVENIYFSLGFCLFFSNFLWEKEKKVSIGQ